MAYNGMADAQLPKSVSSTRTASGPSLADRIRATLSPENIAAVSTALAPFGITAPPPAPAPEPTYFTPANVAFGVGIVGVLWFMLRKK